MKMSFNFYVIVGLVIGSSGLQASDGFEETKGSQDHGFKIRPEVSESVQLSYAMYQTLGNTVRVQELKDIRFSDALSLKHCLACAQLIPLLEKQTLSDAQQSELSNYIALIDDLEKKAESFTQGDVYKPLLDAWKKVATSFEQGRSVHQEQQNLQDIAALYTAKLLLQKSITQAVDLKTIDALSDDYSLFTRYVRLYMGLFAYCADSKTPKLFADYLVRAEQATTCTEFLIGVNLFAPSLKRSLSISQDDEANIDEDTNYYYEEEEQDFDTEDAD